MLQKFKLQDDLYDFPYHYLPSVNNEALSLHRQLNWGLEYMTYMSFVASLVQKKAPESLLDVGCGDGRLVNMVQQYVPITWGVDLSERAIAFARAFNPNSQFLCGDVGDISRQFDMIALIEVLEHIPDADVLVFVDKLRDRVQADGKLLISVPSVNMSMNARHYRHYSLSKLQNAIGHSFEIVEYHWLYRFSLPEKIFRRLLHNPLFTLNATALRKAIWTLHLRMSYEADSTNGAHLVCLAKAKP